MSKQTAVEWLVEQIKSDQNQKALSPDEWMEVIEQAKAMEKEQISNAYVYGSCYGIDLDKGLHPNNYFKEIYKGGEQ